MAHIKLTQKTKDVPGWGLNVERFHEHADSLSCEAALASFMAMSPADRLANSSLVEPSPPSGKKRALRDCGGSSGDIVVEADPAQWENYGGGGGSGGGTVSDPGSETNVTYYTSASGDDGGTK